MSGYSPDDASPRAILLAEEINRQCDQLLAIVAETLADLASHRAGTETYPQTISLNQP